MATGSMGLRHLPLARKQALLPISASASLGLTVDTEGRVRLDRTLPPRRIWPVPCRGDTALPELLRRNRGAHPVFYLVDWPIATDPAAAEIIADAVRRGTAEVGVQLHPWVNPPFEGRSQRATTPLPANLPPALEAAKFMALRDRIETVFGTPPLIYRAGRYGLGPPHRRSAQDRRDPHRHFGCVRCSITVQKGGPDYTRHPLAPYWVDDERRLLELPVTSVHWGLLRNLGTGLQRLERRGSHGRWGRCRVSACWSGIALTPEGVTAEEALRGIDIALDSGLPVACAVVPTARPLAPGHTGFLPPYAATQADVETLYQWLSSVYAELARRKVQSCHRGRNYHCHLWLGAHGSVFPACFPRSGRVGAGNRPASGALIQGPVAQRLELAAHNG